ncbi:MAG: SIMPL domain-containing protein, partial [Thermoleophilia bacterium]|nr:SIMPL domain-containing protein [Gaiellaceae bacterium]MDW8338817.1 SIMPL domain-containing protein [Thermoleophilia bacterium]
NGVGTVTAAPDEAQLVLGVETRGATAREAVRANADAARKIINALRRAGARELATQMVSVYPVSGESGKIEAYAASSSVSAVSDVEDAPGLIDAAVDAGANQVFGPIMSAKNAEELYRQALAKAVAEARARAEVLAKAAGRSLGAIRAIVESGASAPIPLAAERAAGGDAAIPIVPGTQETTATVTVTFLLR